MYHSFLLELFIMPSLVDHDVIYLQNIAFFIHLFIYFIYYFLFCIQKLSIFLNVLIICLIHVVLSLLRYPSKVGLNTSVRDSIK